MSMVERISIATERSLCNGMCYPPIRDQVARKRPSRRVSRAVRCCSSLTTQVLSGQANRVGPGRNRMSAVNVLGESWSTAHGSMADLRLQ
jgi:hypothetical protein